MLKTLLNCWDLSYRVRSMMKSRQGNDMANLTHAVYAKKEIELL